MYMYTFFHQIQSCRCRTRGSVWIRLCAGFIQWDDTKELHPDKAIYQPGMLRKVYNDVILYFMQNNIYTATCTCISYGSIILQLQKGKCKLGRITLFAEDSVPLQLESLGGFELPTTLSLNDEVFMY